MKENKIKSALFWSGGKDSALCLHHVLKEGKHEVSYLISTLNSTFKRISMHGIREELLDQQTEAIGIPLKKMWVKEGSNEEYERKLEELFIELKKESIHHIIFGDIFLEEIRSYREKQLNRNQMTGIFPLWKKDSRQLLQSFLQSGFKAVTCCVDSKFLDESWVGKELDSKFTGELPSQVDPCGENGEFHSFAYDGPIFKQQIKFGKGEKIFRPLEIKLREQNAEEKNGFWFIDLIPA